MSFWRPDSGIATLVQIFSVADPDPEWIRIRNGSGSGMNNPDHISEHLETFFFWGVKIPKFFDADPGWKKFGYEIRGGKNSDPG